MKKYINICVLILLASFNVLPILVHADTTPIPPKPITIHIDNPFNCGKTNNNTCNVMDLIVAILDNIILPIAAVGIVVYIVYAGFTYVVAQGNPKKVEEAHQRLLWALVGAGIILGAAGISVVVKNTIEAVIKTN